MFLKTLRYGKGYNGALGTKCWIARITGTDKQYGLCREFLDADEVEREHFNRARTIVNLTWRLDVGLYEIGDGDGRRFMVVWIKDGKYTWLRPDDERVKAMATLLDGGMSADDARRATRKPAQQPTEQPKGE